ncbi:MAG: heavy-metal-associated domain-containing protein [Ardenticatenaceae bacterium]|nr:heavy-metal-associated domain-containing protein [Ardenticatenaceae bacterium]HBY97461.1 heavy metal transporter [Chloroflexota bacterium]
MTTEVLSVPGISCGHCKATIERELKEVAGIKQVEADVGSKRVTVSYEPPANEQTILTLMEEIGYPVSKN